MPAFTKAIGSTIYYGIAPIIGTSGGSESIRSGGSIELIARIAAMAKIYIYNRIA
jgi:hypothetical protein